MTLAIAVFCCSVSAQKAFDPTPEDISLAKNLRETYSKDDIAILESSDNIEFGFDSDKKQVTVLNKVREKLMNLNYRSDIHKYEFYNTESRIDHFELQYRNGKKAKFFVKDEYYADKDLFYVDARVKYMSVDFPVQGYSYLYEMDKQYDDVKYFTSVYFTDEYPVIDKTIKIIVPDWLDVDIREFNFGGYDIVKQKTPSGKTTEYTYRLKNIPAAFKEENAPGRSYLYPHLLIVAKSYDKDGQKAALFNSTADLYKWYKSLVDMTKTNESVLKPKVDELTAKAKTDEEKIKNIYYWVQDNIRYIAFEDGIAGFKPDDADKVFTKRYGDCKGMANLIKEMLKVAGFDARLAWIGTKHIAYDYTLPSLAVDNHMICALIYKGKKYYLDGTEKFNPFGQYAERIQNKEVMIEDGDKFIIDKIPSSSDTKNKETFAIRMSIDKESLKGKCSRTFAGESCMEFLYGFNQIENNKQKDALSNYLSKRDKNIKVSNLVTTDMSNREQQLKLDYDVTLDNKVSGFDDEIYVDMDFLREFGNFFLKERKTDYQFDYKTNYESSIVLEIPSGYKVDKLPDSLTYKGKDYSVTLNFTKTPTEITCKKAFEFPNGTIPIKEITAWNDLLTNLNTIYKQQIVLTKS
ncbi:transglutaminase-like domain-containing protein [Flavobacterium silvaticum]|nr:transglutaminase-like domain-containing protein [Flavobacterium silvaticum]